ncbi:MAG TPA: DNA repair protein RecO [Spongiibacteraceae bacterium]|nr:DNA repair protein RecO [Spongiibacteraceae bacterium]
MQAAYLLHARDYRDTSLLVELFTEQGERLSAVARGVRSHRRGVSQRAFLQPFQPLWIELGGAGELKLLKLVEPRAAMVLLQRQGLFSGLYLNELLCRVLHRHDPHPELFIEYEHVLPRLLIVDRLDIALRHFELRLLEELGYGLDLSVDMSGVPIVEEGFYRFDPERGLMPVAADTAMALSGRALCEFVAGNYSADARRVLKWLCRAALQPHLGDKPLRSRALFTAGR